jgi:hypothetical protein
MAYDGDNIILENDGSGNLTQNTSSELASVGSYFKDASWADYNNDGQMDIYIPLNNYFGGYNKFFKNNGNANNWLKAKCEGTTSNASGIGSIVTVYRGLENQTRVISNQQKDFVAHFGLGTNSIIDSVTVFWPATQNTDVVYNVAVKQEILITESPAIGIPEQNDNEFIFFPNPASSKIFVKNVKHANISIFNLNGDYIKTLSCLSGNCEIIISDLSAGTYIIRIMTIDGTIHEKLIVQ